MTQVSSVLIYGRERVRRNGELSCEDLMIVTLGNVFWYLLSLILHALSHLVRRVCIISVSVYHIL